jgi:MFS transporter, PAT family, beta-lactamase induction signal transducer AmpG
MDHRLETPERPWIFGLLIAPAAVVANGVIQGGVLAFLLTQQHVDIGRSSKIISFLALPTMLYFLWSPVTDFFVRRRTWLMIGTLGSALFMAAGLFQPSLASAPAIAYMLASACFSQLVVSSCGGMMGAFRSEVSKRVASGFYQAGGMGLGALSVWALLRVSERGRLDLLALAVGLFILVPGMFAFAAPKQELIKAGSFSATMEQLLVESKATFWRWEAIPYLLTFLFPMGSGAAVALLPAVAGSYGVSAQQIGWMNGLGGAVLTAAGALLAPLIPARIRASVSYLSACIVNAALLSVLWLGPLRPPVYFAGVTLYLFTIGTCYALFTAMLLEFLGASGKSGSGRYSVINSLGNVPVLYMLVIDGWGAQRWGPRGLAGTECVVGCLGGTAMMTYFLTRKPKLAEDDPNADPGAPFITASS